MMKQNFTIYLLTVIFLLLVNSCEKNNDTAINNDDNNNDTYNTFTDSRDGQVYKTVTIGNQVWMAENLRYLPSVVGPGTGSLESTPYYYVYGYDGTSVVDAKATSYYIKHGVLYNWEAAKTASPAGWHLPSDAEWTELTNYLGSAAGGKLKEIGTSNWSSPNTGATNESKFTALPSGRRSNDGFFRLIGSQTNWWSATDLNNGTPWFRAIYCDYSTVDKGYASKSYGFSVRCIKD